MDKRLIKISLIGMCMLAAGICYSCGRGMPVQMNDEKPYIETVPDGESTVEIPVSVAEETKMTCYIHVSGEVNNPGVYEMEVGSRVFQAVEEAGGLTEHAAGEYLNMAETIQDGMKISVPSVEDVEAGVAAALPVQSGSGQSLKVNINTAGKERLMTLRGIGESRAEDIIRYREEHGPFGTIEEIMEISGIKDAAFQKIKEDITV